MLQRPRSARTHMNAVEIEQAISELAVQPIDAAEFPFAFLAAFGNKDTTFDTLKNLFAKKWVVYRNNTKKSA
jgi:hypothetical protein